MPVKVALKQNRDFNSLFTKHKIKKAALADERLLFSCAGN
jgi:hypothetical protein